MVGDSLRVSNFFPKNRGKVIARPGDQNHFFPKNRAKPGSKNFFRKKSKKVKKTLDKHFICDII